MRKPHTKPMTRSLSVGVLFLLAGLVALVSPRSLVAQAESSASASPVWEGALFYTWQHVSAGRAAWQSVDALVQRRSARGALILKASQTRRFGVGDEAFTGEIWRDLWTRAYAHLRLSYAPDPRILPGQDLYAELYQGTPGGWELAASYGHRRYPSQTTHTVGLGVGRYVGNWYVRGKTTVIPQAGAASVVQSLRARHYFNAPREYIGVQVGGGRIHEIVAEGPVVQTVRTFFVTAQLQKYVTPHLGFSITASYSDDAFFQRQGVTAGILTRW